MRAIVIEKFGGPGSAGHPGDPGAGTEGGPRGDRGQGVRPQPRRAAHAQGEWAEIADVSGIECVGVVKSCPGGEFAVGTKVAALMGGLGRTINGSYAEYTRPPVTNVAAIESDLPWADLAAIPETYATAWTCLFRNLEIAPGQTLVIRGATSSFGQAALNMAVNAGAKVIATTRSRDRFPMLEALGAGASRSKGRTSPSGSPNAKRSMPCSTWSATARSSIPSPCSAGAAAPAWPGGWAASRRCRLQPAAADGERRLLDLLRQLRVRQAGLSSVGRAAPGDRGHVAAGRYKAKPARVFRFEDIREAHRVMEANEANGKMVVRI